MIEMFGKPKDKFERLGIVYFIVVSVAMVFCCITCGLLERNGNIIWNAGTTIMIFACSLLGGVIVGLVLFYLFSLLFHNQKKLLCSEAKHSVPYFIFVWLVISIAWLPFFLAYYPGICTYDFPTQLEQILYQAYNEHHPLLHTLLIRCYLQIGSSIFHSETVGISLFLLTQMLLLSASFSLSITLLRKRGIKRGWQIFLILYGVLFPFHWYLGISTTKDVLFAVFFLLSMTALLLLVSAEDNRFKPGGCDWLFFLSTTIALPFRNNAPYAMLLLMLVCGIGVLISKKKKLCLRLAIMTALPLVIVTGGSKFLKYELNAVQGDRREMLSVPLQQIARTMYYHREEMDEETVILVEKAIWRPGLEAYRPEISDPVKSQTITYEIKTNAKAYIKLYGNWVFKYPGDMVNAVLALDAGYLNPFDETHAYINSAGEDYGLGYVQTFWGQEANAAAGIYQDSKILVLKEVMDGWADSNLYLKIPFLKYLFVPGIYIWSFLFLFGAVFFIPSKRERGGYRSISMLLYFTPIMGYLITLLLGPTVQLRYIYPVMIVLPVLISYLFGRKEEK